jgi:hypothetical protein
MTIMSSDAKGPPEDQTIWHYTRGAGLVGIANSRALWASSILCLNDSAEFYHFGHVVGDWIKRNPERLRRNRLDEEYVAFLHSMITADFQPPGFTAIATYVASFSEEADDLSQWRAYGYGGGYCVGFSQKRLRELERRSMASGLCAAYTTWTRN